MQNHIPPCPVQNVKYSVPQLRMLIQEVEGILCREVAMDEWNHL